MWEVKRAEGWLGFSCGGVSLLCVCVCVCVCVFFVKAWFVVPEQFQQSQAPKGNLNIVALVERATHQTVVELCTGLS